MVYPITVQAAVSAAVRAAMQKTAIAVASLAACASVHAQQAFTFDDYLRAVEQHSPQLASADQAVIAAEAQIGIAKLRPDPELLFSSERERVRTGEPRPATRALELSWELETGGKRAARIRSARSGVEQAQAQRGDTRQQVLLQAAQAYIEACHDHHALQRKQRTLAAFAQIEQANALRHQSGDIGGVEWRQSRLERDRFAAEVRQAQAQAQASLVALSVPLGRTLQEAVANPTPALDCDLLQNAPDLALPDLPQLLQHSLQQHGDIRTAQAQLALAHSLTRVAQSERWVNPTLTLGTERTRATPAGVNYAGDAFDAAPKSRTLMVSISVPLPLSRLNRGPMVQAHAEVTQAMLALQQARVAVEADIRALWHQYQSNLRSVQQYQTDILPDAGHVLDGMRLAYQSGAASLLELLSAQHDADEVWLESLQAQADLAGAWVQLQLGSGQTPRLHGRPLVSTSAPM